MSSDVTRGVTGRSTAKAMTEDEANRLRHRLGIVSTDPNVARAMSAMHLAAMRRRTDIAEPDDGPAEP